MSIESPPLERKLAAILAADVEGYSRLMHADEEGALAVLSGHRVLIDGLIAEASGHITSTAGDSVLAEFASVVGAVNCAVAIQKALKGANAALADDRRMQLRIGINVGDVMVKDGGIFGDGVNVAARLESLAEPGSICVTRGVRDYVRDRVEFRFQDLGDHVVKNIARPIRVFRVVFDPDEIQDDATDLPAPSTGLVMAAAGEAAADSEAVELAFWKSVEAGNDPAEYRVYLDRYPNGTFAALAAARLVSAPEAPAAPVDHSVQLAFWDAVKDSDDQAMFQAYLDKYPDGEFSSIAALRVKSLAAG